MADERFALALGARDWTLLLRQPTDVDAGEYECQVSSMQPKLSRVVRLEMLDAASRLVPNVSALTVRPGEPVRVACLIEAPQQTEFVYWYKNQEPIQFDDLRAKRTRAGSAKHEEEQQQQQDEPQQQQQQRQDYAARSTLSIGRARANDSANYTCLVSNSHYMCVCIDIALIDIYLRLCACARAPS